MTSNLPNIPSTPPSSYLASRLAQAQGKPPPAREGANIELHGEGRHIVQPGGWGIEGYVIQEFCKLPDFTGSDHLHNRPVLGTWMVGDECYGLGIRESDGPITDSYCRFVPNRIRL